MRRSRSTYLKKRLDRVITPIKQKVSLSAHDSAVATKTPTHVKFMNASPDGITIERWNEIAIFIPWAWLRQEELNLIQQCEWEAVKPLKSPLLMLAEQI